jgi:carbonic anhydrase
MYRTSVIVAAALIAGGGRAGAQEPKHADQPHWDYGQEHGPQHWGGMKAEFATCSAGHQQAPIDIEHPQPADLPAIQFDYKPSPLRIVDNGHTIMVTPDPGSFIRVGDARYELKQFHFHRPSEEKIAGKTYDMVVHLVHADQAGHLAVVAILLEQGTESPLVRELWKDIPKEEGKEARFEQVPINAADLLPADRGYYRFTGSLTTPPCSENVTWFVLKQPYHVSATEIAAFSELYSHNARPTQPLHDRVVQETR